MEMISAKYNEVISALARRCHDETKLRKKTRDLEQSIKDKVVTVAEPRGNMRYPFPLIAISLPC